MQESVRVPLEGEPALAALSESLARAGFRVSRSFDLRSAMAAQGSCRCPDHGTEACTCQFAVLLAYSRPTGSPTVITAHSSGTCTYVSLIEEPGLELDSEAHERARAAVLEVSDLASTDPHPMSHENSNEEVRT